MATSIYFHKDQNRKKELDQAIIASCGWESYPNGNSGFGDSSTRMLIEIFGEDKVRFSRGNPHVVSTTSLDLVEVTDEVLSRIINWER